MNTKTCTPHGVVGNPDDYPCSEIPMAPAQTCKLGMPPILTPVKVVLNTGDDCRPMGLVDAEGKLVFATDCIASDQLEYIAECVNNHTQLVYSLRGTLGVRRD
jgi:hypothetical protein